MRYKLMFTAALILAAGSISTAQAQNYSGQQQRQMQQQMQQKQASTPKVSQAKLEKYVAAHQQVQDISTNWKSKMNDMSAQQKQSAGQKMNQELVKAVRNKGLSVQEYNRIANAVRTDNNLRQRALQMLQ